FVLGRAPRGKHFGQPRAPLPGDLKLTLSNWFLRAAAAWMTKRCGERAVSHSTAMLGEGEPCCVLRPSPPSLEGETSPSKVHLVRVRLLIKVHAVASAMSLLQSCAELWSEGITPARTR